MQPPAYVSPRGTEFFTAEFAEKDSLRRQPPVLNIDNLILKILTASACSRQDEFHLDLETKPHKPHLVSQNDMRETWHPNESYKPIKKAATRSSRGLDRIGS